MGSQEAFSKLIETMKILRGKNGCEWDIAQTHETLKPYLIEESYEVLDAIDSGDNEELKEELGDVLLQVIFHSQIAAENSDFNITDVIDGLTSKLIRRHPHVFGDSEGYSYKQWEKIKAEEKGAKKSSAIGEFNNALPALSMARRVQENASVVGFDWQKVDSVREKLNEEISEFDHAMKTGDKNNIEDEFGDLLFTLVNLSRFIGVDPEEALRKSTKKFIRRFSTVEMLIDEQNLKMEDLKQEDLDIFWNQAKEENK